MFNHHSSRLFLAGPIGLVVAVAFSASAVASSPRVSARPASAYTQLYSDFHRMVSVPASQVKADQTAFETATGPCLTRAVTALLVAQAAGSADASAAKAAYKPLLYEVSFQMIMQSAKPLMTPYLKALGLVINVSGLTGAQRARAVAFEHAFAQAAQLHTCADANTWAGSQYSATTEPEGVKLIGQLASAVGSSLPNGNKLQGTTTAQTAALKTIAKQASKRFKSVIKQIESRGTPWLGLVILKAEQDAAQQPTTTTTTTTTTTSTTPTTTTG